MPPESLKTEPQLTQLLQDAQGGGEEALEALFTAVYRELRGTARRLLSRERAGHTLMATELVNEAYMRLFGGRDASWENRRHFFGSAAAAMRRILIDHARKKKSRDRIPRGEMLPIEAADGVLEMPDLDLLALDHALQDLEAMNSRQARIVELRFFVGLTEAEVAELLGVSRMTVSRDWKVARLRLLKHMSSDKRVES